MPCHCLRVGGKFVTYYRRVVIFWRFSDFFVFRVLILADLHQIHQISTKNLSPKLITKSLQIDGKFEDVTKEMLDGLESDTDKEDGLYNTNYYYVPRKKKKKKLMIIIHNYFCGNVFLTRTKFSDNHENNR